MRYLVTRLALIAVLAALGLAIPFTLFMSVARVSAHASYVSSNPTDKQVLAVAPTQLTIIFDSEFSAAPGTFATVTCNGNDAATSPGAVSPSDSMTLVVPLQPNLPNGKCIVFWKSTDADDGGVTFGRFSFFIGNVSAADVASAEAGASVAVPDDAKDQALTDVSSSSDNSSAASTPTVYLRASSRFCTYQTGQQVYVLQGAPVPDGASCQH